MTWAPMILAAMLAQTSDDEKVGLAVMPLQSQTLDRSKVTILDNLLVAAVGELNRYGVIGANDVNAILGLEKMREAVGCDDISCAAEIGGALGVAYILVGTVDVLGDGLIFTLTLLNLRTAASEARKSLRIENKEDLYYDGVLDLVAKTFGVERVVPDQPRAAPSTYPGGIAPENARPPAAVSVGSEIPVAAGTLVVEARPPEAKILVDGSAVGAGYVMKTLSAGIHAIDIWLEGYKRHDRTVIIEPGKRETIRIDLIPIPNPPSRKGLLIGFGWGSFAFGYVATSLASVISCSLAGCRSGQEGAGFVPIGGGILACSLTETEGWGSQAGLSGPAWAGAIAGAVLQSAGLVLAIIGHTRPSVDEEVAILPFFLPQDGRVIAGLGLPF